MGDERQSGGPESRQSRGPEAGARLKAAREARNVSLEDIARELHLDSDKLRALESNRFDVFSAPVFVRGYLRKYASLIGVPEAEVIGEYDELSGRDDPPPVVVKAPPVRRRYVPSFQAFAVVLLLGLIGVLGWWAFSGSVLKPLDRAADVMPGGVVLPDIGEEADTPPDVTATIADRAPLRPPSGESAAGDEEPRAATVPEERNPSPALTLPEPEPEPDSLVLVLSFDDECWVEIGDGEGRRVFAGIARSGQTRRFEVRPPVSLVLGNADAASIEVDGEPYRIASEDRRGRTARITLAGATG